MKTILVDAVHAFVVVGEGIYKPMHDLLEQYQNRKIPSMPDNPSKKAALC